LSVEEIAALVASFKAGTLKWQLAEFYGMDIKSVKKLLREEGVRKRSGYDPKPYVTGAHCSYLIEISVTTSQL
jgi:hypothetical protein